MTKESFDRMSGETLRSTYDLLIDQIQRKVNYSAVVGTLDLIFRHDYGSSAALEAYRTVLCYVETNPDLVKTSPKGTGLNLNLAKKFALAEGRVSPEQAKEFERKCHEALKKFNQEMEDRAASAPALSQG